MKTVSGKEFTKILEKKGVDFKRIHGSHFIYSHPDKLKLFLYLFIKMKT